MTFTEQLTLTVIDKVAIGGILLMAAWLGNKALDKIRSRLALENEIKKQRESAKFQFLVQRLSEFYWPIYLRLEKDNAVWTHILDRKDQDELRRNVGKQIEKGYLLPNHEEIVKIIESKIHLAAGDEEFIQAAIGYMRHVAVYRAIRLSGVENVDPISLGEPWPQGFFPLVEKRTRALQSEYNSLLKTENF